MLSALKSRVPERVKGRVLSAISSSSDDELSVYRGKPKAVVALAGFYQNLGDMALTYSQSRFLQSALPDHSVLTISSHDTYSRMRALQAVCTPDDVITIIGGGNMDDLYSSLEDARIHIVRSFPRNRVVSFPQTIAFSDSARGHRHLRRSARGYSSNGKLTLFAREPESLRRMRDAFPRTAIGYAPDIVMSLELDLAESVRAGVLVCLRQDLEARLTSDQRSEIIREVVGAFEAVEFRDTVDVGLHECLPETYESTLMSFWSYLRTKRLVVTDRLHCMIFCALTKTPCVILSNSNHKISGTYDTWLRSLPYLAFVDNSDPSAAMDAIQRVTSVDLTGAPDLDLSSAYGELRQTVRRAAGLQ